MKILFSADHHIKLGQRKVPKAWQINRFHMMIDKLNEVDADLHIMGGDIFDVANPSGEEQELYFDLIEKIKHKTLIYTGNHEMTSKTKHYLTHVALATNKVNPNVQIVGSMRTPDFDIIDYVELTKKKWDAPMSKLCFTHVRGEIPPHVVPEVELERFDCYDLVLAGDLHSHTNSQRNIVYPGSPLTTSFHRNETKGSNGYIIVDTETLQWEWHELGLPQLIRKTVSHPDEMEPTDFHHTIYEIEGDLDDLAKIDTDSELLDKKVNKNVTTQAKLDLNGNMADELATFLYDVQGLGNDSVARIVSRFKEKWKDDNDN